MANEKRLIDANALKDALRTNDGAKALDHSVYRLFYVDEIVDAQPTVDAVEVVHGRWIRVFDDSAGWVDMCNKCKEFGDATPYCPNCGAKMDGGNEDG